MSEEIQLLIDEEVERKTAKNAENLKNELVDRLIAMGKNTAAEISFAAGVPIEQVRPRMSVQFVQG